MRTLIANTGRSLVWLDGAVKMWLLYTIVFALGRFQLGCAHAGLESVVINDRLAHKGESSTGLIRDGEFPMPELHMDLEQGDQIKIPTGVGARTELHEGSAILTVSESHVNIENPNTIGFPLGRSQFGFAYAQLESVIVNHRLVDKGKPLPIEVIRKGEYLTPELHMVLQEGDEIKTPANVRAFIKFHDGSEIITMSESHIKIENPKIRMWLGRIIARIKGKFKVETKYVTVAVEGTEFIMYVGKDNESAVIMIDGGVVLTSNRTWWPPVLLKSGLQARIQGREEPQTEPIPQEEYDGIIELINALRRMRRGQAFTAASSTAGGGGGWPMYATDRGGEPSIYNNGGYVSSPYGPHWPPLVIVIPEPATVLLLSLAGLWSLRKRGA